MLKRMAFNIGSVSVVLAIVMIFASLSSILLARVLSASELGEFGLMRTLILLIAPLAIWGQDIATARFFSQNSAHRFRWDLAYRKIISITSCLIFIGTIIASFIYHLESYKIVGLFFGALFYASSLFFSNLVRSQQRYRQAILMISGFRGLFFFLLLIGYFAYRITKVYAISIYIFLIVAIGLFNFWYAFRSVPRGSERVPSEMHTAGLIFMGIQGSIAVLSYLDGLFIPKILGYEALGLYTATVVPAQMFTILARASKYVWVPEFGRSNQVRFKLLTLVVAGIALVLFLLLVFGAEPILDVLYKGKYNQGANLLRVLALVGVFRLFYGLSSSLIIGKLSQQALKYHLGITIASMILYSFILIVMLKRFGVLGAGFALLLLTFIRMVGSYWIVYKFKNKRSADGTISVESSAKGVD